MPIPIDRAASLVFPILHLRFCPPPLRVSAPLRENIPPPRLTGFEICVSFVPIGG